MTVTMKRGKKLTDEELRIWRERGEARDRIRKRMEEEYHRVKAEHPDKWVAFSKDGVITASDDLLALVDEYTEMGYGPDDVLIEFTHVSTIPLWGEPA